MGTQSIGNALTAADVVVVGRVKSHEEADYSETQLPAIINVEVIDSIKGDIKGNVEIAKTLMCYQSFSEDDLEVGKIYVFPLQQIDLSNAEQTFGLMIGSDMPVPSHKMFRLPVCSHNGLLVDGQDLYTSELVPGGGRQLKYYMPLFVIRALLPIGLLSTWGIFVAIAIAAAVTVGSIVARKHRRKAKHAV
jgi:hypothetical protein